MDSNANRSILPDGRIVVRTSNENNESEFIGSGAGDSLTIPALQRVPRRACVVCAAPAELYCGRCELTPYCGARCQRTDWLARHSGVCHNLMRSSEAPSRSEDVADVEPPNIQPAMPLRKPHSPAAQTAKREQSTPGPSGTQLGNNLMASLVSTTPFTVSLVNVETGAALGEGEVSRWLPEVEWPVVAAAAPEIPEVSRPDVAHNSRVLLVKASALDHVLVRPADKESMRKFSAIMWDVLKAGVHSEPLKEPPTEGQTVIGLYADEIHHRALCRRTNVKQNKYLLEYEFGYWEVTQLEKLYPCPAQLTLESAPTQVSLVKLQTTAKTLTAPATQYLDKIWDDNEELVLTIPSGAKTASTGDEVCLTVAKNKESVNRTVTELCAPDWKKLLERGFDVLAPEIPEVSRPDVAHNSRVLLVQASALDRVLVLPADEESMRKFGAILRDVLKAGDDSEPLKEPPTEGQTVIGLYADEIHHRALCRRTNVKQNKYLLEYVEFDYWEVTQLEKLYPCPAQLTLESAPTQVSLVKLQTTAKTLTAPATQYLDKIRDDNEELVLTIPSGAKTASTGDEVCLTVAKNKESVNRTVTELCTPDWKKLLERGFDVLVS